MEEKQVFQSKPKQIQNLVFWIVLGRTCPHGQQRKLRDSSYFA